jgi:hypothetical protein
VPWVEFIWFVRPLEKIAEHGVTRDEVEFVVRRANQEAIRQSATSEHMIVRGYTASGRIVEVVFDWADPWQTTVAPVTAYEKE